MIRITNIYRPVLEAETWVGELNRYAQEHYANFVKIYEPSDIFVRMLKSSEMGEVTIPETSPLGKLPSIESALPDSLQEPIELNSTGLAYGKRGSPASLFIKFGEHQQLSDETTAIGKLLTAYGLAFDPRERRHNATVGTMMINGLAGEARLRTRQVLHDMTPRSFTLGPAVIVQTKKRS